MVNYRPISLLNVLNKIIERLIYSRLYGFLDSNDFLYKFQYGFRSKASKKTASVELINKILNALNEGKVVTGVFLDLAKAFDTVDHGILMRKLEVAGVRGCALDLFRSYLSNRTQTVFVNGSYSKFKSIRCGVPQGKVYYCFLYM